MKLSFTKMQGCANDYIYLDCRESGVPENIAALSQDLSRRHFSIGADGIICICAPVTADADGRMRIFNADGSEAQMCGNGVRCVAEWLYTHGVAKETLVVDTNSGTKTITRKGRQLWQVEMGGYSAMAAALTAYNDAGNADVPYESPSNKDLRITGTVLEDGTEVLLDQQQASDVLNANGVITAINANGFKLWGNNTAAYPSITDPKDRWLAVRRFFDWDGNNFICTYMQKVDKPGNKRLIQSIVDSQNVIGNGYVARDYCAGYRVEFRSDENPVVNLLNGHLTVHTFLAPYIPAEYIENIREYDVDALQAAFGGN